MKIEYQYCCAPSHPHAKVHSRNGTRDAPYVEAKAAAGREEIDRSLQAELNSHQIATPCVIEGEKSVVRFFLTSSSFRVHCFSLGLHPVLFRFTMSGVLQDLLNLRLEEVTTSIIAEYIWIGGSGLDIRSKARTIPGPVKSAAELPKWNFDGSSTGQAPGDDSEIILYPQAIFRDPFRRGNNILVICDCYTPQGVPIPTNKRAAAAEIFKKPEVTKEEPWYGIEQEYTLLQKDAKWPLGWPVNGYPGPQGPYYCGTGADKAWGRDIVDAHYKACLYAGIQISGVNGEVMPGQWEYQVGPVVGISSGDQLWVSRYILERITEIAGVVLTFDPKPIEGDWNGAGCHTNYSTKSMRENGGYEVIKKAIEKLGLRHKEHIAAYGEGNERRLTGHHETASINHFSWGVANRGASVRVGRETEKAGKGYFEDRRPASNMDPYVVTSLIAQTTILFKPEGAAGKA
ncbi:hypothetical protein R1flu_020689 [Riccia fluitans]|uniref:Glutamine synthetase n=1 Tax=Riccia fluitans TaxID=41844 RepID=A0ABD1ZM80_9MARC